MLLDEVVRLEGVSHIHAAGSPWARPALQNIDLEIRPGERVLITGPNGCGKSTLAWILAGLTTPTEGSAVRSGEALVEQAGDIGLLVQHTRLQLLRANVAAEIGSFNMSPERIRWAIGVMGFPLSVLSQPIDALSVGQQRRVGLALLIGRACTLTVLDEPMAGLDAPSRAALVEAVEQLPRQTTVITVTHDLDDSLPLGRRVITLDEGRIVGDRRNP